MSQCLLCCGCVSFSRSTMKMNSTNFHQSFHASCDKISSKFDWFFLRLLVLWLDLSILGSVSCSIECFACREILLHFQCLSMNVRYKDEIANHSDDSTMITSFRKGKIKHVWIWFLNDLWEKSLSDWRVEKYCPRHELNEKIGNFTNHKEVSLLSCELLNRNWHENSKFNDCRQIFSLISSSFPIPTSIRCLKSYKVWRSQ